MLKPPLPSPSLYPLGQLLQIPLKSVGSGLAQARKAPVGSYHHAQLGPQCSAPSGWLEAKAAGKGLLSWVVEVTDLLIVQGRWRKSKKMLNIYLYCLVFHQICKQIPQIQPVWSVAVLLPTFVVSSYRFQYLVPLVVPGDWCLIMSQNEFWQRKKKEIKHPLEYS